MTEVVVALAMNENDRELLRDTVFPLDEFPDPGQEAER